MLNRELPIQFIAVVSMVAQDKQSTCNSGDAGSISGSGSSPGKGNRNPLQHSCLENPTDRGACPRGLKGLNMTKQQQK